jgi:alginate O-acetyltransferase complex protein AlgI
MLFNSIEFCLFLPIVFLLFWGVKPAGTKAQNWVLLFASYVFYGWWDVRFLGLIAFSSILDFTIGKQIFKAADQRKKKLWLIVSLGINLGLLATFKYYNFFIESISDAFTLLGNPMHISGIEFILPVGISFYTFQTLSYSIDIYNKKIEPSDDLLSFLAFVSFFPQLVAGPIERASQLLPQFKIERNFNLSEAINGSKQMLWGLFKKVAVADTCAVLVNDIFNQSESLSSVSLILGAVLFSIQIYGDFSGYSDIAIGCSRLFGINLMRNFAFPYLSRDIAEFWRRWHISLSTWFRDYVYIPLGGSRASLPRVVTNTFIIFILSGFWHGANWTFIFWGFLNALYFLPLLLLKRNRLNTNIVAENTLLPSIKESAQIISTFAITALAWIFFRSENLNQAFEYVVRIFTVHKLAMIDQSILARSTPAILLCVFVYSIEFLQRKENFGIESLFSKSKVIRHLFYYFLIFLIGYFSNGKTEFIYFQF